MGRVAGAGILCLAAAARAWAGFDGVIEGHVYGCDGIALSGAAVLVDLGTFQTLTDDAGFYRITGLPPGTYLLRALVPGA
jgi:hypothetical protein